MGRYMREAIMHYEAKGAVEVLEILGLTSGEISKNKAASLYGTWFLEACRDKRIEPCRIGKGPTGTKHYRLAEILALRADDFRRAELQSKSKN